MPNRKSQFTSSSSLPWRSSAVLLTPNFSLGRISGLPQQHFATHERDWIIAPHSGQKGGFTPASEIRRLLVGNNVSDFALVGRNLRPDGWVTVIEPDRGHESPGRGGIDEF